jgi:hypothetical protein
VSFSGVFVLLWQLLGRGDATLPREARAVPLTWGPGPSGDRLATVLEVGAPSHGPVIR